MVKKNIGAQITLFAFFASVFFGAIFLDVDFGFLFLNIAFRVIKPILLALSFISALPLLLLLFLQIYGKDTPKEDKAYYGILKSLFHLSSLVIFSVVLGLISAFISTQLIKSTSEGLSVIVSIALYCSIVFFIWIWFNKKFKINIFIIKYE